LPSPGFQVEVVLVDHNGDVVTSKHEVTKKSDESSSVSPAPVEVSAPVPDADKESGDGDHDKDDVFSDGEAEHPASSRSKQTKAPSEAVETVASNTKESEANKISNQVTNITHATEQVSLGSKISMPSHSTGEPKSDTGGRTASSLDAPSSESEFKAMAADASVFTFGDDEDYESDWGSTGLHKAILHLKICT